MTSKDTHAVVLLGRITGVFGVKGWVKVFSYTQPRENIASFANWQIGREGRWRQAKVADCRVHGKGVIARLEGVDDRDEAAPLIGNDIGVLQADLPPCGEGEYYWNDLIGQEVVTRSGDVLGRVDHLIETGANDVLVVKGERERLIPFVQGEVVLEVDLETGRILVEWDPDFWAGRLETMQIAVVSLFPRLVEDALGFGVAGRALERGLVSLQTFNPRDFARDIHRTVDDRPYGGGPGMVMKVEPLRSTIRAARESLPEGSPTICLSPQGRVLDQAGVARLARLPGMLLVSGRYEGIDERLLDAEVDEELCIGDYVLSGGEFAALVVIDATLRLLPGVLGDEESARQDSFVDGLLDCPHYTRPERVDDMAVPEVLLGGNHEEIRRWRLKQALGRTWQRRPALLDRLHLNEEQEELLREYIAEEGSAGTEVGHK